MWFKSSLAIILVFALSGCAATRKETKDIEMQQLQMKVNRLNYEIREKDEQIEYLQSQLEGRHRQKVVYARENKSKATAPKASVVSPKNIQIALKKGGFYDGPIDGKIGKGTKKAIIAFQKENNLVADGVVGKNTWMKLKRHMD